MDVMKMYDHSDCIQIDKTNFTIVNGERYYRIKCIKEFKDSSAKRTIKKGEIGGLVHESIVDTPSWIEEGSIVGATFCETVAMQLAEKEPIKHSCILMFKTAMEEEYSFWRYECGCKDPSLYNAYVSNSTRMKEFAEEMYLIDDEFISQSTDPTNSQMIVLWVFLGAIAEAILKLHIIALRIKYHDFISKEKKFERMKATSILELLESDSTLSHEEYVSLSKINGNRNSIHFLNNESVDVYDVYYNCVDFLFKIGQKLFEIEKRDYDPNIKLIAG